MIIKGLEKQTVLDYPGKLACTIFLFGCNFRCGYCHNPELLTEDGRPEIQQEEILKFLEERKGFLDGVCITGGEPTINKDLPEFIYKIKELGFDVKLDTNGSNPDMIKSLVEKNLIDYIAMDIKAPIDSYDIASCVKVDKDKILESVNVIKNFPEHEFRTTAVPGIFTKEDARKISEWLKGSKKFFIQNFRGIKTFDKTFENKKSFTKEELESFQKLMKPYFEKCEIRGV
ncbi:MAG: anaerobic ribonucleoside-triphosphate reductase activating protein [Candidatus Aenigmarchaeota archaeon]|nr:anaerobic ribonucleoside-triphosphate reductase activating protein [Candidatus Aenigmarchaeota archaeon]